MSLLFETIRLQNGVLQNLEYHNFRLNQSRKAIFHASDSINLDLILHIPDTCLQGIFKCKIIYTTKVEDVYFEPYLPRPVNSLKLITDDTIAYNFKYTDRNQLDKLYAKRGTSDEILIVRNGFITDTSFSNITFYTGDKWLTPAIPLLAGTMRSFLIENKTIIEAKIKVTDLPQFQKARLINAMLPFESEIDIPVEKISY